LAAPTVREAYQANSPCGKQIESSASPGAARRVVLALVRPRSGRLGRRVRGHRPAPPGNCAPILRSRVHRADRACIRGGRGRGVARRGPDQAYCPLRRGRRTGHGRPDQTVGSALDPLQFARIRQRGEDEFGQQVRWEWQWRRRGIRIQLAIELPVGRHRHRAQHLYAERAGFRVGCPGARSGTGTGTRARAGSCSRPCPRTRWQRRSGPLQQRARERRQQHQSLHVAPLGVGRPRVFRGKRPRGEA
jgi:hypothetical protein